MRLWDAATGAGHRSLPWRITGGVVSRGVQPRRQDRPHRQRGQDGAALGRRHRPAHRASHGHTGAWSGPWRSAPTARPSSPAVRTRRRGSGTPPPAEAIGPPMAHQGQVCGRGVQPRRQDRPHRQSATGRRGSGTRPTGKPIGPPMDHQGRGHGRGVQPRRQDRPHRQSRQDGAALDGLGSYPTISHASPTGPGSSPAWSSMSRAPSMRLTTRPGASAANGSTGRAARRNWADVGNLIPSSSAPNQPPARAWIERKRWAEAEAAFDEAVLARPSDVDVVLERARFHAARSRPEQADDDFLRAYALGSRDPKLIETILRSEAFFSRAVSQHPDPAFSSGSRAATIAPGGSDGSRPPRTMSKPSGSNLRSSGSATVRCSCSGPPGNLISFSERVPTSSTGSVLQPIRVQPTTPPGSARWPRAWTPTSTALVRLAEVAVNGESAAQSKADYLNTLGAALYRAGQFDDAIRRLEEGIRLRSGDE